MFSVAEELKNLEKRRKDLEKGVELENELFEKEKEYLKAKEKYENFISKLVEPIEKKRNNE